MKPVEIKENIFWVGALDFEDRDFHGYARAPLGTTYNAFLIKDEKTTLFDTVKHNKRGEFFCNVSHLVDLEEIDYIVVNHLEEDHSGVLEEAVERIKPEKIFCSPMGEKSLKAIFHEKDWPLEVIKPGNDLSLGKYSLSFLETRMLHWPDNMATYVPQAKLLISSDAFGQNWATSERFTDEVDKAKLYQQLKEYYANIVQPYSPIVLKTLDRLAALNLEIDMIAPDHGLIYRGDDCAWVMDRYREFAESKPKNKALLVYDTMWHSTEQMIHAVADGLLDEGVNYRIMNPKSDHHSAIMTELMDCGALVVGSPTHNNGILPFMASVLQYMKGLKPLNKVGGAVGSFGWSGECIKILNDWLAAMSVEVVEPGIKVKHHPEHDDLKKCVEFGKEIATRLKQKIAEAG